MDWFLYNRDLRHEIVKQYRKKFCDLFGTLGEKFNTAANIKIGQKKRTASANLLTKRGLTMNILPEIFRPFPGQHFFQVSLKGSLLS